MSKWLCEANGIPHSTKELESLLAQLGVKSGDTLCVHSELISLAKPLLPKAEFLKAIIDVLLDLLGKDGTLLMPTFTYSFCKDEVYDALKSPGVMGVLSEHFRRMSGVRRSMDPIFSFAVFGARADMFMGEYDSCFGKGSVYDRLCELDGKILLFGTQDKGYTLTHHAEELVGVGYRFFKEFRGESVDINGVKSSASIKYYVRHLDRPSELSVKKQKELLLRSGNFNLDFFGIAPMVLINAKAYLQTMLNALKKDENALLEM